MFCLKLSRSAFKAKNVLSTLFKNDFRAYAVAANSITRDDKRDFMAAFPDIVRDLTNSGKYADIPEVKNWYIKVLQHNVSTMGKRLRGLTVVYSYKVLAKELTEENVRLSHVLGWCVEMLQGFLLVSGDVMDGQTVKRNRTAWFENPQVGLSAVNDSMMIENGIYELLRIHFKDKPYYVNLMEIFHDTTMKTEFGQSLDLMISKAAQSGDLSQFTMDKYNALVKYRTSSYTFILPVALAMYMAGIADEERHRQAKRILLETGRFFQIQDDFIDVFGDTQTGKIGTDIRNGKCTWLAVVALQRSNEEQSEIMRQCYGSSEPDKIDKIKNLYLQLGLPAVYNAYEEDNYNMINMSIQQLSRGMPHDLFFNLLENIYKRFR